MSVNDFNGGKFIPQDLPITVTVQNYAGWGMDVIGSFTGSDNITIQGTTDGKTFTTIFTVSGGAQVTNNLIIAAGHYSANIEGFTVIKIVPSGGFSSSIGIAYAVTKWPPP